MTEKWDEIQGKLDLVRVSRECDLSRFYSKLKYFLYFFSAATWFDLFETESGILEVSLCSFPKCDFFLSCALFAAQTDSRFLTSVFGLSKIANIFYRSETWSREEILTGVFTISKSWFNSSVANKEMEVNNYRLKRVDRVSNTDDGGIFAFVLNHIKINIWRDLTKTSPSGFQQLWFSWQLKKPRSAIICVACKPPSCPWQWCVLLKTLCLLILRHFYFEKT